MDYKSKRWQNKRKHILHRDGHLDQVLLRQGIRREAKVVHHILPAQEYPEYQFTDWNLISISESTHNHLHEQYTGRLSPDGWELARSVAEQHGIKLTTLTLVIGLPATGKTTWTRQHLGGGLAYDLDAIASAFRLGAEQTSGSRRMAAAIRQGFINSAYGYASNIFIIRSAPDYDELSDTAPDKLVVCTKQYKKRGFSYDAKSEQKKIDEAVEWAKANQIEIEFYPGTWESKSQNSTV